MPNAGICITLMATKDEIASLLEAEIGPLKTKLSLIEKTFSELESQLKSSLQIMTSS